MPEMTSHAPGTPSWVDLATPDTEAAVMFYDALFGWTAPIASEDQAGGYRLFQLRGIPVAGAAPIVTAGHPPSWTTYITVADADETMDKVRAAGGTVIREPMDVMTAGRMAVFADPTGAMAAAWQPGDHIGAGVVNEPGSLCWNELTTRDGDAARAFYREVFGWTATDAPAGDQPYTRFRLGGRQIGGMIEMDDRWPADIPAHWMVYFAVENTDATVAHAQDLGGTVSVEPFDLPVGRFAVLHDPHGALFSVIAMN